MKRQARENEMTITIYKTALEAIRHSVQFGEIGHCEDTPENHERLFIESDGNDGGRKPRSANDYWKDDPDSDHKMLWRVNVPMDD